ncbi:MAG: hypothetical protein IJU92_08020 [Spirochaetaceae bacterium]|nr:hypothetical protein [Spirochaetaceae bacterium]
MRRKLYDLLNWWEFACREDASRTTVDVADWLSVYVAGSSQDGVYSFWYDRVDH